MNLLNTIRFVIYALRIKFIHFTSRFPPLPGGVVDEQTALLRQISLVMGEVPLDQTTVEAARAKEPKTVQAAKVWGGLFEDVPIIRDVEIPSPAGKIPARLYQPEPETGLPLFVFIHGGGWVLGSLVTADAMARFICKRAHCVVLSVGYRLAPEAVFHAAVDDSFAAVSWAVEHAAELNGDPRRVLVGGDSAGGNLSAAVAQMAVQRGAPKIVGQVLLYASLNLASLDTPSYNAFGNGEYYLPKRDVEWFIRHYLPNPLDRLSPMASPLLAQDLHGLAPALIVTAEFDVLRDEGEAYAKRLEEAGVPMKLIRCNGMAHGFLGTIGLLKRAEIYFDQVIAEIGKMTAA